MSKHYGIVGGGILGMTLALRLREAGHEVTLCEAADHLGGLASAWKLDDIVWDRHYHVTLLSDLVLRNVLKELGLDDDMIWVETKTGFYTDGTHYSMSNTLEFLKFPPLDLISKFRLGGTIFYASKIKGWEKLEDIPVDQWLRKLSGKKTFEKIWLPLLRAKLGDNYQKASAAFIWAIIQRMYAARQSGLKKEMFGYLDGGYARLLDRFAEVLVEKGVDIRTSHMAQEIVQQPGGGVLARFADKEDLVCDELILSVPSPLAARLCPGLTDQEKAQLGGIQYQGIICASVVLKKPLRGFYVTNITEGWVPFTAVIEMTALVDPETFGGRHLVYLPKYVDPDDPAFELSDKEFEEQFVGALLKMYPELEPSDVLAFQVSRVRNVLALSTLGYSKTLPPMDTSVEGLHVINSSHIVNGTLNVNETILLAEQAAKRLA